MRKLDGSHIYSVSDLITFMESEYAYWMDRFYLECPSGVQPDKDAVEDRILQAMGEATQSGPSFANWSTANTTFAT